MEILYQYNIIRGSTHTSRKVVGSCTLRSHIVRPGATGKSTQEAPTVEEPTSRSAAASCEKLYFVTCTFKTPSTSDTVYQNRTNLLRRVSAFASNIASHPPHPPSGNLNVRMWQPTPYNFLCTPDHSPLAALC